MNTLTAIGIALFSLIATFGFAYYLARFLTPSFFAPKVKCHVCGHEGKAKIVKEGSSLVELALFFFFIIPGIIYSMWRKGTEKNACAECGAVQGITKVKKVA